jgi:hypothetical protein
LECSSSSPFSERFWKGKTFCKIRIIIECKNCIPDKNKCQNSLGSYRLERGKGQAEASLSRQFVEWLILELNVDPMLAQLNSYGYYLEYKKISQVDISLLVYSYGVDEYFLQVLAGNEFMEAPNGYTLKCKSELTPGITRY